MKRYTESDLTSLASGRCVAPEVFRAILADANAVGTLAELIGTEAPPQRPGAPLNYAAIPQNYAGLQLFIERRLHVPIQEHSEPAPEWLENLVPELQDHLYRYAYRRLRWHPQDAEDVVQETICRAVFSLDTLVKHPYVRAWLFTVAHNLIVSQLRSKSRTLTMSPEQWSTVLPTKPTDDPVVALSRRFDDEEVQQALLQLTQLDQAIVLLRREGYDRHQVAETLRISPGNGSVRFTRAIAKLTKILGGIQ